MNKNCMTHTLHSFFVECTDERIELNLESSDVTVRSDALTDELLEDVLGDDGAPVDEGDTITIELVSESSSYNVRKQKMDSWISLEIGFAQFVLFSLADYSTKSNGRNSELSRARGSYSND